MSGFYAAPFKISVPTETYTHIWHLSHVHKIFKMIIQRFALAIILILAFVNVEAQNVLDIIGLTSSNPASVAFSVRQLSSSYSGPLCRVRVGSGATSNYYDVYPDESAGRQISLFSKISTSISFGNAISSATSNSLSSALSSTNTDAYVAIWYDQSGNNNDLQNNYENNQPKIIQSSSIITANNKPFLYWWDVDIIGNNRSGRHVVYLSLKNPLTNNGHVIVVNKFGETKSGTDGSDGFLLGDNSPGSYYWHSNSGSLYNNNGAKLFADPTSPSLKSGSIYQNGIYKTPYTEANYNKDLAINSIIPQTPNTGTYWDNIGNERGGNTGGLHFSTTGAGWSEILSFSTALSQSTRTTVEGNQLTYFDIVTGITKFGQKTIESSDQVNRYGKIGSSNPVTSNGKINEYKKNFITNGLVLNLDAGNSLSYPGTGNTWADLSGNMNNGTLNNVTFDANTNSLVLNGTSSRIGFLNGITSGNYLTYEAWVNRAGSDGVIANSNDWSTGYVHFQFFNNRLQFALSGESDQYSSFVFNQNTWYHVATVYSRIDKTISFYVNGTLTNVGNYATPPSIANQRFNIGAWESPSNTFSRFFSGKIAQFRSYNIALNSTQVLDNYNASKAKFGQ